MFKKSLLSILCLSTLSSQAKPWINAKFLYPFIAAQTVAASGYYFNDAYKIHKKHEFNKREDKISECIASDESLSFYYANQYNKIPIQYITNKNDNDQLQCQALQNIRDRLEYKVHKAQKTNKKIKLMITPTLSKKHFTKLLKRYEQHNEKPPENMDWVRQGFAASHGCIIHLPLRKIAKLYKFSNGQNVKHTQDILTKYENQLQKIYAGLGHELSHLENNDMENKIAATATIPLATEVIWQIGAQLFKRKPSPSHLTSFQFLYKTAVQLPIGAAKFCLTGILLAYYKASQEYRCDRQSIEYMGIKTTQANIKWFESKTKQQEQDFEKYLDHYLFVFYLTATRSVELFERLGDEFEEAQKNNDKEKQQKIMKKMTHIVVRFDPIKNKIFPLNDSVINFMCTIITHHPSDKYRAERLKKLLEQEEQKQK